MVLIDSGGVTETVQPNAEHLETKKPTICERFHKFRKVITVEPVAFLALFSSNISSITSQTLALQKACRVNLNLGDEICESLLMQNQSNNFSSYEKLVQEYYSSQVLWRTILQTLLPCILLLFIGGWSDKTGRRKIVLLIPILGGTLNALSHIINVIFFYQLPLQVLIFFDVFFVYVTGGFSVTVLGLMNYICAITTAENRTHRLGVISLFTYVSIPLGISLSGIIFKLYGYYAIYGITLSIDMMTVFYIMYRLSDPPRSEEQKKYDGQGLIEFLKTFFNLTTIRDSVRIVCKKTLNNRRIRLCVLLASVIILYGPIYGEASILFMSTRYRFNWDEVRYSLFQTYNYITTGLGTTFSIVVLSKYLKLHDSILGITSCISRIIAGLVFCFAPNEKIFFIGPAIDLFNATAMLAIKSMSTKFLETTEIGKFNSMVALIENLTPLMYVPMFTKMYTMTMDSFPGAVYLIGATMVIPAIFVFIWLLYKHTGDLKREKINPTIEVKAEI